MDQEKFMKFVPIVLAVGILLSGSALADDSMKRATPSKHQMMKACIEKQKTADVNMSKSEMQRICKDEVQRQTAGDTAPPPSDAH
jgi:pentapeptide MXKDX repeat protein